MRAAYIYVLHFEENIAHAFHYSGCTEQLSKRLRRHAAGAGGKLCRAMMERGIGFRLGAVSVCTKAEMRRMERTLKDQHNGPRYCGICNEYPQRVGTSTPVDLDLLTCVKSSEEILRHHKEEGHDIRIRFVRPEEGKECMATVLRVQHNDKDALGFIPAGGAEGLQALVPLGQIAICNYNGTDVGFCAYTVNHREENVTIQQCCVEDWCRGCGCGRAMVSLIRECYATFTTQCRVRINLAANNFWRAIGFREVEIITHKTSGSSLVAYRVEALVNDADAFPHLLRRTETEE